MNLLLSRLKKRLVYALMVASTGIAPAMAEGLEFSDDDTITVTADSAWEAEEVDVLHFSGDFTLQGPDWSLTGDTAVVYGKLDDPDRVVVEGNPARISFLREADASGAPVDEGERVDGGAALVEYFRASDKLTMQGTASLTRKESTLHSDRIEYDVDTDRYAASGAKGIRLILNPEDE